jgi:hypothetical protein
MSIVWGIFLLLLGICCLVFERWNHRETNQAFDPIRWKQIPLRWKMLNDLKKSKRLIGMPRQDIYELLGPPDEVGGRLVAFFSSPHKAQFEHLAYRLDDDEKCDYLVLHINESDCVVESSHLLGW